MWIESIELDKKYAVLFMVQHIECMWLGCAR